MKRKIKISDLTDAERKRYIEALEKLLKKRYINGDGIKCPLCAIAEDVRNRMETPDSMRPQCDFCTWNILYTTSNYFGLPCGSILENKFGIVFDFDNPAIIKYRKRTIPNEIKILQKNKPQENKPRLALYKIINFFKK